MNLFGLNYLFYQSCTTGALLISKENPSSKFSDNNFKTTSRILFFIEVYENFCIFARYVYK